MMFIDGFMFFILILVSVLIVIVSIKILDLKFNKNIKTKKNITQQYSIKIYDLSGKIVMEFSAFYVEGNDNTIFYEDEDGKQRIIYVPKEAIVTIEEV